jgi:RimJ/RimL family protein N-acetyltransferase
LILYGHSLAVAEWVGSLIPYVGADGFNQCEALGVLSREGSLIAGVVYSDYQPKYRTIQISIASVSPMWARRENIRELLDYPFHQLDVFKAWTSARSDNGKAIRSTQRIGFKQETVLKHQYGEGMHAHVFGMLKPDYLRLYGVS